MTSGPADRDDRAPGAVDAIPDDREDLGRPLLLVASDGTDKDEPALRWALDLASALDGTVEVVHAVGLLESVRSDAGDLADEVTARVRRVIAESGGPRPPDVALRLLAGPPAEALLDEVAARPPLLLVMGRGPAHRERTSILGSVSRVVVDRSPVPVVVVPAAPGS